jgi:hypothetical protein
MKEYYKKCDEVENCKDSKCEKESDLMHVFKVFSTFHLLACNNCMKLIDKTTFVNGWVGRGVINLESSSIQTNKIFIFHNSLLKETSG